MNEKVTQVLDAPCREQLNKDSFKNLMFKVLAHIVRYLLLFFGICFLYFLSHLLFLNRFSMKLNNITYMFYN